MTSGLPGHVVAMARNNACSNHRLLSACVALSAEEFAAPRVGFFPSLRETFERIHRSNLVGMGVLPLQFKDGMTRRTLNLTGHESFDVGGIESGLRPGMDIPMTIHRRDGTAEKVTLTCRIDTAEEIEYFKNGGVLHYVLRNLAQAA